MTDVLQHLAAHRLLPPRFLKLAVTGACNLRCRHCWPDCGPGAGAPVPVARVLRLLEEFRDLGGSAVSITGGEPLTHPEWHGLLAGACRVQGLEAVELQTNATLLDGDAIAFLGGLAAAGLSIRISLDGASKQTNDSIRGEGTFGKVLAALDALGQAGLLGLVVLSMTETASNYPEIPELLCLAERHGVPRVETATLLLRGRAAGEPTLEAPRPEQVAGLVERYDRDTEFHRRYDALGCTSALEWARWFPQPREHYCNFVENPFVDVHGRFFPCAMYEREDAAVEGAFQRPLADLLLAGAESWGCLRRASRERISDPGACAGCSGWSHCRGGCFGRSVEPNGDASGREDRCAQRRAVYALRA